MIYKQTVASSKTGVSYPPPISRKTPHLSEAQLRHVEFANLDISKVDPKKLFVHLLKAEILKGEYLADEDPVLVPADISA